MSEILQQSIRVSRIWARPMQAVRLAPGAFTRASLPQRSLSLTAAIGLLAALTGCGSNLRPTTTPIVGTGPAPQPASFAFIVSTPPITATSIPQGVGTVVDYSGDTVMATAPIGPGPVTFTLNSGGSQAWTLNADGTVSNIPVTTNLQAKQVFYSTLNPIPDPGTSPTNPQGLDPVVALFGGSLGLYALDVNANNVDVLTGSPDAFKLVVPVDQSPVTMVGVSASTRYYTISQMIPYLTPFTLDGASVDGGVACNVDPHSAGLKGTLGMADAIETATYSTPSAHIPLGVCPVYAVASPDTKRVFVLNRGSDTISVINSQNNAINNCSAGVNQSGQPYTCHPCLPLSAAAVSASCPAPANGTGGMNGVAAGLPAIAGPVYAEYNSATSQIIVSNYDGNSISIIDVSLDIYGNDSANFGNTYTVPVGKNPAAVTVLADGSRAYTANQSDSTVSIVSMSSHVVENTLPVTGHPRTVVSTQNSNFGKVYVVSPDSPYVTIIRTDQDIISTTVLTQGNAIDVRTTSPDTSTANTNLVSRLPGAGQPCYLPPSAFTSAGVTMTLTNCKYQDATQLVTP
jgi:YVTN family beta-propeller protein